MANETRKDYTIPQAAKSCGCAPNTVKAWILSGKIRAYRLGGDGHYRIPWSELDRKRADWSTSPDTSEAL